MFRQSLLTAVALYLTLVSAQGDCKYYHTSCSASQYGVHECNCGGDGIVSYHSFFTFTYALTRSIERTIMTIQSQSFTYLPYLFAFDDPNR